MTKAPNNAVNRLMHWQNGEPRGPVRLTVFPTNICNIECKHCWQRWDETYDKTYKSEMSDERLMRLVDEAHELGVQEWYFVGGGDAMARGKLVMQMAERICELGMNGGIHTNGTLFRPGMFEKLIDIEWRLIWVSLDGPNEEINDYIRSRGFKKATDNLKRLAELKKERGAKWPTAGIYTTLTNMTYDKIVEFVELAHECGCDEGVNISGLIVEGEESGQFELTAEQKKELPKHIEAGIRRAEELGVKTNFRTYLDDELIHDGMDMHRNYQHQKLPGIAGAMCYEPWTSMSLLPDGRMGPCCAFYDENIDTIKERSLVDVWNGTYMSKVREGMVTGCPPDYCKRCPSNMYIVKERHRASFSNVLLEQTQLESLGPAQRAARLAAKGIQSLKKHGIRKAVERGLEWRKIHIDV